MNKLKNLCAVTAIISALGLVGCGAKDSWLKGVNVVTSEQNGNNILSVKAYLNTGDIPLPGLDLPIYNPQNPNVIWGRVAIRPQIGTQNSELEVQGNLSNIPKTSNCPAGKDTLPNGLKIPVSVTPESLVCFTVANSKAMVFVASDLTAKTLMVGTAIPIKQFDDLADKLPDANAFLKFSFDKITGNFGAFTGTQVGQNGLALFVDASGVLGGKLKPQIFKSTVSLSEAMVLQEKFDDLRSTGETLTIH